MLLKEDFNEKHIRAHRMGIPYRAEPDEARPCEAFDIRDARMGMNSSPGKDLFKFFANHFHFLIKIFIYGVHFFYKKCTVDFSPVFKR